jgi:hypothetical protein
MPEKKTIETARRAKRSGKAPSTQAGAFVAEEIDHVRQGKHGARSTKQAIAIGLAKARRAGVKLAPPKKGTTSSKTRQQAAADTRRGQATRKTPISSRRSRASKRALQHEGQRAASHASLARQARSSARKRSAAARSASAKQAARTRKAARRK